MVSFPDILLVTILFLCYSSGLFQAERAKDKEELEDFREDLDKTFTSMVPAQLLELAEPEKSVPQEHMKKDEISEQV